MKILAVDDDEFIRDLLVGALSEIGLDDITVTDSAESALELVAAAEKPFECLLLDIRLPGKNGLELCSLLRRHTDYTSCPILMITSVSDKAHIDRAFRAGASDYVTKPLNMAELAARISFAQQELSRDKRVKQDDYALKVFEVLVRMWRKFSGGVLRACNLSS